MTATGGAVSDWTDPGPGNVYRSHVFTSTGTFVVSDATSDFGSTVDYLVVAGGGGGGAQVAGSFYSGAGGGGAGGLKTSMPGVMPNTGQVLPLLLHHIQSLLVLVVGMLIQATKRVLMELTHLFNIMEEL